MVRPRSHAEKAERSGAFSRRLDLNVRRNDSVLFRTRKKCRIELRFFDRETALTFVVAGTSDLHEAETLGAQA